MRPHGASRRCEKKRSASSNVQNPPPVTAPTPAAAGVAREPVEVRLPAAAGVRRERPFGARSRGREGVAHVGTDFVRGGADRGTEPRDDLAGRHAERRDGSRQHAVKQPAPARMRDADTPSGAVAEQHRQAVRRQHGAHDARREVDRRRPPASRGRRSRSSTVAPCTCSSQTGSLGRPMPAASRARFSATLRGVVADVRREIQ